MRFIQTSIVELFSESTKEFKIPVYQRAYSWEKTEWTKFLEDIEEQLNSENNYYYGNLLLEVNENNNEYEIIDGQQRMTTITIFIRALIDVLNVRDDTNIDTKEKEKIYFKNSGIIKLRPVEYDRAFYDSIIVDGDDIYNIDTNSQKRMLQAKTFFYTYLLKRSTDVIQKYLEILEKAYVNCIEFEGKKESSLMFELENNRGKELTNLEKIKSYFMYQIYINSKENETEINIKSVSNIFEKIYLKAKDLSIDEDSVLVYHCNAYINGYSYRSIEDIKNILKSSKDKVEFIIDFVKSLHISFSNMKYLEENSKNKYLNRLKQIGIPSYIYPFLIKGLRYLNEEADRSDLYDIMEKVVFRYKLVNTRADIKSRLNEILLKFYNVNEKCFDEKGNIEWLRKAIYKKFNDTWYWSERNIENYLKGYMFNNKVLKHILYNYENHIQKKGYTLSDIDIESSEIEHISPQTPCIGRGYEVDENGNYSDEFKEIYLNSLGNLMIISKSHNCSIGNCSFDKKLKSYIENPILRQQLEIKEFINGDLENPIWDSKSIQKRSDKILKFVFDRWNLEKITL